MRALMTFDTATGGTVEPYRIGTEIEMVTRDAAGYTIATVRMPEGEAWALLDALRDELEVVA